MYIFYSFYCCVMNITGTQFKEQCSLELKLKFIIFIKYNSVHDWLQAGWLGFDSPVACSWNMNLNIQLFPIPGLRFASTLLIHLSGSVPVHREWYQILGTRWIFQLLALLLSSLDGSGFWFSSQRLVLIENVCGFLQFFQANAEIVS